MSMMTQKISFFLQVLCVSTILGAKRKKNSKSGPQQNGKSEIQFFFFFSKRSREKKVPLRCRHAFLSSLSLLSLFSLSLLSLRGVLCLLIMSFSSLSQLTTVSLSLCIATTKKSIRERERALVSRSIGYSLSLSLSLSRLSESFRARARRRKGNICLLREEG